jgi:hypothetical protein
MIKTDSNSGEISSKVHLEHIRDLTLSSKSHFKVNGNQYYWYEDSELVDGNGLVLAQFYRTSHTVDADEHKVGKLIIKDPGKELVDLVVITSLIVQENSEEGKQAVKFPQYS